MSKVPYRVVVDVVSIRGLGKSAASEWYIKWQRGRKRQDKLSPMTISTSGVTNINSQFNVTCSMKANKTKKLLFFYIYEADPKAMKKKKVGTIQINLFDAIMQSPRPKAYTSEFGEDYAMKYTITAVEVEVPGAAVGQDASPVNAKKQKKFTQAEINTALNMSKNGLVVFRFEITLHKLFSLPVSDLEYEVDWVRGKGRSGTISKQCVSYTGEVLFDGKIKFIATLKQKSSKYSKKTFLLLVYTVQGNKKLQCGEFNCDLSTYLSVAEHGVAKTVSVKWGPMKKFGMEFSILAEPYSGEDGEIEASYNSDTTLDSDVSSVYDTDGSTCSSPGHGRRRMADFRSAPSSTRIIVESDTPSPAISRGALSPMGSPAFGNSPKNGGSSAPLPLPFETRPVPPGAASPAGSAPARAPQQSVPNVKPAGGLMAITPTPPDASPTAPVDRMITIPYSSSVEAELTVNSRAGGKASPSQSGGEVSNASFEYDTLDPEVIAKTGVPHPMDTTNPYNSMAHAYNLLGCAKDFMNPSDFGCESSPECKKRMALLLPSRLRWYTIFKMLFGSEGALFSEFHSKRKDTEIAIKPWSLCGGVNPWCGKRSLCWKSILKAPAPSLVQITESQCYTVLRKSQNEVLLTIASSTVAPSAPFGNCFTVETLIQFRDNKASMGCHLEITTVINFKQQTPLKKQIIQFWDHETRLAQDTLASIINSICQEEHARRILMHSGPRKSARASRLMYKRNTQSRKSRARTSGDDITGASANTSDASPPRIRKSLRRPASRVEFSVPESKSFESVPTVPISQLLGDRNSYADMRRKASSSEEGSLGEDRVPPQRENGKRQSAIKRGRQIHRRSSIDNRYENQYMGSNEEQLWNDLREREVYATSVSMILNELVPKVYKNMKSGYTLPRGIFQCLLRLMIAHISDVTVLIPTFRLLDLSCNIEFESCKENVKILFSISEAFTIISQTYKLNARSLSEFEPLMRYFEQCYRNRQATDKEFKNLFGVEGKVLAMSPCCLGGNLLLRGTLYVTDV